MLEAVNGHSLRGSVDWNCSVAQSHWRINVTPYAGVWIEMPVLRVSYPDAQASLPTRECGLKFVTIKYGFLTPSHSLRGSVDWNISLLISTFTTPVTPYAGVWIEIHFTNRKLTSYWSLPTRECGLKSLLKFPQMPRTKSLPTRECGLKCKDFWWVKGGAWSLPTRECGLKYEVGCV